jgi:hypothetical protein
VKKETTHRRKLEKHLCWKLVQKAKPLLSEIKAHVILKLVECQLVTNEEINEVFEGHQMMFNALDGLFSKM